MRAPILLCPFLGVDRIDRGAVFWPDTVDHNKIKNAHTERRGKREANSVEGVLKRQAKVLSNVKKRRI